VTRLETLAAFAYAHELDLGGNLLRTGLIAQILTDRLGLSPDEAIDLAERDAFDDRVRAASYEAERLIEQARRAALAVEYGEAVPA
ncbi:hypothetical protein JYK22_21705, partial [Nonomuraea sp. RK-328]|nr:hypothetical protein [Nonomuraea sp. RK-328]